MAVSDDGDTALAMVATSSHRLPDLDAILAACELDARSRKRLASEVDWENQILLFPFNDSQILVTLMPMPIPWKDLEGPCATAWWWPKATKRMKAHKAHFVGAIMGGDLEPVERRILLTRVISSVVATSDAVGVYWGDGTLIHEPSTFIEQAKSIDPQEIPGQLWIDIRVEPNENESFRCFTTGMAPLGFAEIEVTECDWSPDTLWEFIGDMACYVVNNRLQMKNGETMGRSATEQFRVRHGSSMFDRPGVMRLQMV